MSHFLSISTGTAAIRTLVNKLTIDMSLAWWEGVSEYVGGTGLGSY